MFNKGGGILFHGNQATLFVDRGGYSLVPEGKKGKTVEVKSTSSGNANHWANFLGVCAHPRAPYQRYREVFRFDVHLSAGQRRATQPRTPGLGRA